MLPKRCRHPLIDCRTVEPHRAAGAWPNSDERACQRRLSRAAWADNADRVAGLEIEIDIVHEQARRARRRNAEGLHNQLLPSAQEARACCRRCGTDASRSSSRRPLWRAATNPRQLRNRKIDRRERAARQDRACDHDAAGGLLLDDQIGADGKHARLERRAQRPAGRAEPACNVVGALLLRRGSSCRVRSSAQETARHAHGDNRFGIAPARLEQAAARGGLRGRVPDRRAGEAPR